MRIRALLFIPALAAAALAIGVSSASAATIFLTNNHAGGRVTIGATATATSQGNVDLTSTPGVVFNRCTNITLHLRVTENTVARSSLEVYGSTIPPNTCHPLQASTTHAPNWKLTITGAGTMIGTSTAFAATAHNVQFDLATIPGVFTGNLEGLTATQNTVTTNELCVDVNGAGPATNHIAGASGFLDARFCLDHPATTWSLT